MKKQTALIIKIALIKGRVSIKAKVVNGITEAQTFISKRESRREELVEEGNRREGKDTTLAR
jgi:hypothetical protein